MSEKYSIIPNQSAQIEARIQYLKKCDVSSLKNVRAYSNLTEIEKIPFRIRVAEIMALEEYLKGYNLEILLNKCVENEQYSGAEGIKRAIKWINEK